MSGMGHPRRFGYMASTAGSPLRTEATAGRQKRREWDGPAALPPPTALRVRWGYQEKESRYAWQIDSSSRDHHRN